MKMINWFILLLSICPLVAASELPGDSIYHVDSNWRDQDNRSLHIGDFRDKVQVMAFIYTYCGHSCPMIMAKMKSVEKRLTTEQRRDTRFLLVTLDPERDSPEILRDYRNEHRLNPASWTLLNGDAGDVLELSALVGVKYRPMDVDGNDIAHSNMITILDKSGRIHFQMKGLNNSLDAVLKAIETAVR